MNPPRHRVVCLAGILICGAAAAAAVTDAPVAVSPGSTAGLTEIADQCPTFSWARVEGAQTHELVVYRVAPESSFEVAPRAGLEDLGVLRLAVRQQLPGRAGSWTPPVDQCLSPGERYGWSVRALGDEGEGEWSETRLFTLAAVPSVAEVREALRLWQQHMEVGGTLEGVEPDATATPEHPASIGSEAARAVGRSEPPSESTAVFPGSAAIRGEQSDATGMTFGVVGESTSPDGFGVGAANTAGGADLVLDGAADGATDALLTQAGIDRPSATAETFDFRNSDAGSLTLQVDGIDVVTTATDQDILGALSCAEGEIARWYDLAWHCDIDVNTLYSPGFGLDLVGTTFSADTTEVQHRVTQVCPPNRMVRQINENGTMICDLDDDTTYAFGLGLVLANGVLSVDPAVFSTRLATLDSSGDVGSYTSVAIGADGLGLISYYDQTNTALKVAHCNDTACTSATRATVDDPPLGSVGYFTSIVVGADGLGLISYRNATNADLKVAHCDNTACTTATYATLDTAGDVGSYTSIAIGADELGLISYSDVTNTALKVAHCDNTACTSATTATLDTAGNVGSYTSIAIGTDGLGLISYYDFTNGDLKVAHCSNAACTSATTTTLDSAGTVGLDTSVAIGADGLGLISYYDFTNFDLKVAHCNNTACTSATTVTRDSAGTVGLDTSVAIGADGLGLISYYDFTNSDLKVAHCQNTACTTASTATLDWPGTVGSYTSIVLGADGLGLISYFDATNDDLKVAHLGLGVP